MNACWQTDLYTRLDGDRRPQQWQRTQWAVKDQVLTPGGLLEGQLRVISTFGPGAVAGRRPAGCWGRAACLPARRARPRGPPRRRARPPPRGRPRCPGRAGWLPRACRRRGWLLDEDEAGV